VAKSELPHRKSARLHDCGFSVEPNSPELGLPLHHTMYAVYSVQFLS
jgi:hypothetical protein